MDRKLVTVIIPVYNAEKNIAECIDSIISQEYKQIEIICIDIGSIDNSLSILEDYRNRDGRINVFSKMNRNIAAAKNFGLSIATGEYVLFVSCNDRLAVNAIQELLKKAHERNLDILYFDYTQIIDDYNDKNSIINLNIKRSREYAKTISGQEMFVKMHDNFDFRNEIELALYKHEFLNKESVHFYEDYVYEDELFTFITALKAERVSHVKKAFYEKRIVLKNNEMYSAFDNFFGYFYCCARMFKIALDMGVSGDLKKWIFYRIQELSRLSHFEYNKLTDEEIEKINISESFFKYLFAFGIYGHFNWVEKEKKYTENVYNNLKKSFSYKIGRFATSPVRKIKRLSKALKNSNPYKAITKKNLLLQTPLHCNIGDHAIAVSEDQILGELGINYIDYPKSEGHEKEISQGFSKRKTILVTGGGWMGSLYINEENRIRQTIRSFYKNRIIVFPQTVFFEMETIEDKLFFEESKKVYESHSDLTIFLRDKYSYDFMKQYMPNVHVELVPDVVFLLSSQLPKTERKSVLLCLRNDKERTMEDFEYNKLLKMLEDRYGNSVNISDMDNSIPFDLEQRNQVVNRKLLEFASSKLVITDRLHGMIFATITETPCIVIPSRSYKILGSYDWIKNLEYIQLTENINEIPLLIEKLSRVTPKYEKTLIEKAMKPLYDVLKNIR